MLWDGKDVEHDAEQALQWFVAAAQSGYPQAITALQKIEQHFREEREL